MEDIDDTDFISKEEICEATYKTLIDEEDTKIKGSYFSLITGKKYAYNNLGDFIQLIFDHPKISPGSLIASRRYTTINPALFDKEIPNFFEIQKILTKLGKQNTYTRIFEPIKLLIKNAMLNKPVLYNFTDLCKSTYAESNELIDRSEIEVIRDEMKRLNDKMLDTVLEKRLAALKTGGSTKRSRTKRSRTKRSRTKRSSTKRSSTKRSSTKRISTKRISTKRISTKRSKTKGSKKITKRSNKTNKKSKRSRRTVKKY